MPGKPWDNSAVRLVLAVSCLMIGVMNALLLDGQPFRNDLVGVACAGASVLLALGPARDPRGPDARHLVGGMVVAIGVLLAAALAVQIPSAYRSQRDFNRRAEQGRRTRQVGTGMLRTPYLEDQIQNRKI